MPDQYDGTLKEHYAARIEVWMFVGFIYDSFTIKRDPVKFRASDVDIVPKELHSLAPCPVYLVDILLGYTPAGWVHI